MNKLEELIDILKEQANKAVRWGRLAQLDGKYEFEFEELTDISMKNRIDLIERLEKL